MKPSPYFSNTAHSTRVQHRVLLYGNDTSTLGRQLVQWQRRHRVLSTDLILSVVSTRDELNRALQHTDLSTFTRFSLVICQPDASEHFPDLVGCMTRVAHEALFLRAGKVPLQDGAHGHQGSCSEEMVDIL